MLFTTEAPKVSFLRFTFSLIISISIGALIVYDITDQDSFNKMSQWVKELRQQVGSELPIIVVGNKCDMESKRVV